MKQTKKGFTLVELLVVIAILAILATVSIVGYTSFIMKANLSNDQTTIAMINKVLMAEEVFGKPETISEAMDALRANGFSYEKQVPYSAGYHYAYHMGENRFYLLDKSHNVCYPEAQGVDVSQLWLPYRNHPTSIVPGISLYYAVGTVSAQEAFNESFGTGNFTLDLNGNVCTVNKSNDACNVRNGYILGTGFIDEPGIVRVEASNENNTTYTYEDPTAQWKKIEKITYKNVLNPTNVHAYDSSRFVDEGSITVEYINCVFTTPTGHHQDDKATLNITFKDCTFINIADYAVTFQPGDFVGATTVVTMDGCEFINCDRGLNIGAWENTTLNITNCKFSLRADDRKYNCLQVSHYASDADLASLKINFTNNEVVSANGVVYFHDGMTGPQSIDSFKAVFGTFSGNTYATNVVKIADRGQYSAGHALFNNTTAMEELATYVK